MKVDYTKVIGGIDTESPAMALEAGRATSAVNYEPGDSGGMRRIDGYEAFDGHPSPSDAVYYRVEINGTVSVGDTITGASGATGVVFAVDGDWIAITKVTGTFVAAESITVSGSPAGTLVGVPSIYGYETAVDHATGLYLAAEEYRDDIAKPPGSGPVRGGGKLGGTVYVFRDNAGGTAGDIWTATASGWVQVDLFHQISFNTGTGLIVDGDTITQAVSGATALVKRVVLETGAWGTDAAGRLIITNITGTFNATNNLEVTGAEATATSLATAITRAAGGKVETRNYNFFGQTSFFRMYGCDGVNQGFEFDGTTYVPLNTTAATDIPEHVACHKLHLFFSIGSTLYNSAAVTPFSWAAAGGANDTGMGDDITALEVVVGEALAVYGERGVYQLLGSSVTDFQLDTIRPDSGAEEWSVQTLIGSVLSFGQYGVTRLSAAESYGNFSAATVTRHANDLVKDFLPVASSLYRSRNQYRLYAADGTGLIITSSSEKRGMDWVPVYYLTTLSYPININQVFTCDDGDVFLCDDSGNVYQADKGMSFDGLAIESYFTLAYNHSKSPGTIKSYFKATFEMTAVGYAAVRINPDFTYGDPRHPLHSLQTLGVVGAGGRWDVSSWDTVFYDSRVISSPSVSIRGNGENMAMSVYTNTYLDQGHRIDGIIIQYLPRRLQR